MEIARARVLIIATDRFEQSELFGPREMLMDLGAEVTIASIEKREILATVHDEPGATISATATLDEVSPDDFDALILRSEEHTSELQSLMRISYAVFCLTKKHNKTN